MTIGVKVSISGVKVSISNVGPVIFTDSCHTASFPGSPLLRSLRIVGHRKAGEIFSRE